MQIRIEQWKLTLFFVIVDVVVNVTNIWTKDKKKSTYDKRQKNQNFKWSDQLGIYVFFS